MPVIATNWSGTTEFMKDSNAWPIPVSQLVDGPEDGKWAQVNVSVLVSMLQRARSEFDTFRMKGLQARVDMLEHFSLNSVALKVIQRVEQLRPLIPEAKQKKNTGSNAKSRSSSRSSYSANARGSAYSANANANANNANAGWKPEGKTPTGIRSKVSVKITT
jgi:hypothetical protein